MPSGFIDKYSPEFQQRIKDRLQIPEIRQAMSFWVAQAINRLGQVKSQKQIKAYLLDKLGDHGCTLEEVSYIMDVAQETFNKQQELAASVTSNGNHRKVQN